jgi:phosphatidylinositol alpha-mannosyltransferase
LPGHPWPHASKRYTGRHSISRPLRICLVSSAYRPYPSGVSEHVSHLARTLAELGQDVEVLTSKFARDHDDSTEPVPVTRIGRVVLVPMNRSYATLPVGLRMAGQVKRFLDERGFDIVHCHGMFWPELSYWAIRHSHSINLVSFLTAGFRISRRGGGTYQKLFRGQLAKIHGLVPISNRARAAFAAYVPGDHRIIPCGVDLDRFRPDLPPLPDPLPDGPNILFLGRLDGRKGITVLLRAMPDVLQRLPTSRLIVVGEGPEEQKARALTERLGITRAVDFLGQASRADLPRYYAGCDVYCSPTLGGETLGIVLLEAMAANAPVVATDIPGYDETIRKDQDGLLVPPQDSTALAAAIIRVLTDRELRDRLVASGRARTRTYAWPVIGRRTLDYYRELLVAAGRSPD